MKITRIETDDGQYYIEMRDPKKYLFGVFNKVGGRKSRKTGFFEVEMLPSSRADKWIEDHTFTFKKAVKLLEDLERNIMTSSRNNREICGDLAPVGQKGVGCELSKGHEEDHYVYWKNGKFPVRWRTP